MNSTIWRHAVLVVSLAPLAAAAADEQPTLKTVTFPTPSVGRTLKYRIVLPAGYDRSPEQRYPVLYLLHGYNGSYVTWSADVMRSSTPKYPWIIVMPDGGNSWWINWAKSEGGQKNNWEDAIVKDLIPHIDSTYRTIALRAGRAIDGMSMGGFGSLVVGMRNPDLFCTIGSHAGALMYARTYAQDLKKGCKPSRATNLEATPRASIQIEGFSSQVERSPLGEIWETPEQCAAHDPYQLVLRVPPEKLPHIYFDGGTEDGFLPASQELLKVLMENKVPFTYAQAHGAHGGPYWRSMIGPAMAAQFYAVQLSLARGAGIDASGRTATAPGGKAITTRTAPKPP